VQSTAAGSGAAGGDKRCACRVRSSGHCSQFHVQDQEGLREQLLFAASQPGVAASPAGRDRVLAYETITNHGPQAVTVFWDGSPPDYKTAAQNALLLPGNSITVAAGGAVKIEYTARPGLSGSYADGSDVISWCCPKPSRRNRLPHQG
jgi:hypothetical protein